MSARILLAIAIVSFLEEEVEKNDEVVVDAVVTDMGVLAFVFVCVSSLAGDVGGVDAVVVECVEPIMVSLSPFGSVDGTVDVGSSLGVSLLVVLFCGCVGVVTVFVSETVDVGSLLGVSLVVVLFCACVGMVTVFVSVLFFVFVFGN